MDIRGVGPVVASRVLADVGDVTMLQPEGWDEERTAELREKLAQLPR